MSPSTHRFDIMKKLIVLLVVLACLGSGAWAFYNSRSRPEPQVTTLPVSRGDVAETVQATGTLEAVTTVDVGTQVSGVVQDLYADFNQIVRKGQVIARLDPSILQTQIESQKANVVRAEADLERLRVALADAKQKLDRAQAMFAKELVPRTELENADLAVKTADAQIKSSEASLSQSRASLNQAQVNIGYTVIHSPIDGIVISRNVDPGQTVASSMNAPTLFVIAADLSKMQVLANIDEAEIGRMRPGQSVNFRVDAYPTEQFIGAVEQVRLQPTVVQNVVVYSTVIAVPNPQLKLKPGMTANVVIEVARRNNVLRVPAAALRFRPTELMFTVLNQPMPPEARGGGRGGSGGGGGRDGRRGGNPGQQGNAPPAASTSSPAAPAPNAAAPPAAGAQPPRQPAAPAPAPPSQASQQPRAQAPGGPPSAEARGGGDRAEGTRGGDGGGSGRGRGNFDPNMSPEERRKRMEERMAAMSPEEREQFQARMRDRGFGGRGGGRGDRGDQSSGRGTGPGGTQRNAAPGNESNATARRDPNRGLVGGVSPGTAVESGHTTIDSLFAPIQIAETAGRVWLYAGKQLRPVRVRTGVTDGTWAELIDAGELTEAQEVVINMVTGLEPRPTPGQGQGTGNPLMGPQRGGPGRDGGRGGGGGR
jgi:HlyD family secretion protein